MTNSPLRQAGALLWSSIVDVNLEAQATQRADTVRVVGRIDDMLGIARSASQGRIGATDMRQRPITGKGELRVRTFGDYRLVEDNSVRGTPSTLVNADVEYEFRCGTRLHFNPEHAQHQGQRRAVLLRIEPACH